VTLRELLLGVPVLLVCIIITDHPSKDKWTKLHYLDMTSQPCAQLSGRAISVSVVDKPKIVVDVDPGCDQFGCQWDHYGRQCFSLAAKGDIFHSVSCKFN
jgi:hypothetical protein